MISISGHKSDEMKTTSGTVQTLAMTMRLLNSAGSGSVAVMPILRNISVKARLIRAGIETTIINGNAEDLGVESNYEAGLEAISNTSGLIQKGAGYALLPIRINLPGPLCLQSGDQLITNINVMVGSYPTGLNVTGCAIEVDWTECQGIEDAIPVLQTLTIQASSPSDTKQLGDDIQAVCFINYDQGYKTAAAVADTAVVLQSFALVSDTVRLNETADSLFSRNYNFFPTITMAQFRGQIFKYQPRNLNHLMDDVRLELKFNPSLVTQGNNVIVVRRFVFDGTTLIRSAVNRKTLGENGLDTLVNRVGGQVVKQAAQITNG